MDQKSTSRDYYHSVTFQNGLIYSIDTIHAIKPLQANDEVPMIRNLQNSIIEYNDTLATFQNGDNHMRESKKNVMLQGDFTSSSNDITTHSNTTDKLKKNHV